MVHRTVRPHKWFPWQEASRSCNVDVEPLPVTLGHNQGKSGLLLVPLSPSPTQAAAPLGCSTRCSHSPLLFFWPHFPSVAKIICIYTTKLPAVYSRGKKKKKKRKGSAMKTNLHFIKIAEIKGHLMKRRTQLCPGTQ